MRRFVWAAIAQIRRAVSPLRVRVFLSLLLVLEICSVAPIDSTCAVGNIDNTDCQGHVLDDSAFPETVVRDHRDSSYGALANSSERPLGGGEGYSRIVGKPMGGVVVQPSKGAAAPPIVVKNVAELTAALAAAAQLPRTIYVDDAAELDLSYCARSSGCRDHR